MQYDAHVRARTHTHTHNDTHTHTHTHTHNIHTHTTCAREQTCASSNRRSKVEGGRSGRGHVGFSVVITFPFIVKIFDTPLRGPVSLETVHCTACAAHNREDKQGRSKRCTLCDCSHLLLNFERSEIQRFVPLETETAVSSSVQFTESKTQQLADRPAKDLFYSKLTN